MNYDAHGTYNANIQINSKTTMLKSSLCEYSDAEVLLRGTITITGAEADAVARNADKKYGSNI